MAILAMDTATQVLAVGLANGGQSPVASVGLQVPRGHSRLLQPTVRQVLQAAGLEPKDIHRIVVGTGPGSYTGVRMAVSTAKAMAAALDVPLAIVSSLAAMAGTAIPYESTGTELAVAFLYARRGRAFGAIFLAQNGHFECLVKDQVRPIEDFVRMVDELIAEHRVQRVAAVTDFTERMDVWQPFVSSWRHVHIRLGDVAGNLASSLLAVDARNQSEVYTGAEIHNVVPDYTLVVEAEAKLETGLHEREAKT